MSSGGTAAIYVRISSDKDGERAGVERQRADCLALADRLGLTVADVYEDNDVSAYSGAPRPAFDRMLGDAQAGMFGNVVVWASDRLYRRVRDLTVITDTLAKQTRIHVVNGGEVDLTTAEGILRAQVLGSVAEFESRRKGERVRARAEQRAAVEGRQTATNRPFGWAWADPCPGGPECAHSRTCDAGSGRRPRHGTRKGLVPDPVDGPLLADAIRSIADGASLRSTLKRLRAQGVQALNNPNALGLAIRNPRHAGLVAHNGQVVAEAADRLSIIDRATWERATAVLADPSRRTATGRPVATPLGGGLLRCGLCGGPMAASNRHGKTSRGVRTVTPVYTCSRHHHLRRPRHALDGAVLDMVGGWIVQHGQQLLAAAQPAADDPGTSIRIELADLEQRLADLAALVASGDLGAADFAAATRSIRAKVDQLTGRLAQTTRSAALAAVMADRDGPAAAYARLRDAEDVEPLRRLLAVLLDRVEVLPCGRGAKFDPDRDLRIVPRTLP